MQDRLEYLSACPACSATSLASLWSNASGYNIARCQCCGFGFVNPQPTDEVLAEHYSSCYRMARDALAGKARIALTAWDRKRAQQIDRLIRRFNSAAKSVCEIGCSFGYLLVALRERGWLVKGYELSEATADFGRRKFGLDIEARAFPSDLQDTFYAVILIDVLEHLKRPRATVADIFQSLHGGGLCIIMVPNMGSLNSRLFGRHCVWVSPPDHLSYFTPASLSLINS